MLTEQEINENLINAINQFYRAYQIQLGFGEGNRRHDRGHYSKGGVDCVYTTTNIERWEKALTGLSNVVPDVLSLLYAVKAYGEFNRVQDLDD